VATAVIGDYQSIGKDRSPAKVAPRRRKQYCFSKNFKMSALWLTEANLELNGCSPSNSVERC